MDDNTARPRRIAAHYVYTPQGILRQGIVSVDRDGVITDITTSQRVDSLAEVEHYSGMLIPGFINSHSHLELSFLEGAISADGGLTAFAAAIGAVRTKFSPEQRDKAARFYDAKMWSEGVDAVADICNGDTTFSLKKRSRIAYSNFIELFGLQNSSAEGLRATVDSAVNHKLTHTITPHSTYSLNTAAFDAAIRHSNPSLPLSIHFMESSQETDLYKGCSQMWEWYRERGFKIDFQHYGSPTTRIIETIPAQRKVMLIHNTFLSQEDLCRLVAHFGNNLTLVLCPRSNEYISCSLPDTKMLMRSGVRIALGTDSLASNSSLSMVEEMRMFPNVPLHTLLHWATLSGAEALGIESHYGSIEVGKRSGLVLLSRLAPQNMSLTAASRSIRIL